MRWIVGLSVAAAALAAWSRWAGFNEGYEEGWSRGMGEPRDPEPRINDYYS
jgi:hypothetical protein